MIKKINQSLNAKIFMFLLIVFVFTIGVLAFRQLGTIESLIQNEALEKAKSDLHMTTKIIDTAYPGDWRVEGNELYKGNILMNENYELIDEIGQWSGGDTITILLGDTRISTNVMLETGNVLLERKCQK